MFLSSAVFPRQAGKRALKMQSFLESSIYLLRGTVLISDDDWEHTYNLCLELSTSAAEAQLTHGHNEAAVATANVISLCTENV